MNKSPLISDRAFYRRVLAVMTPVLIQNVITNFVSLLDNLMIGQVGTEQMSGVAIVNQLLFVYNLCLFGGMAGAGIFTAQFFGRGDQEGVRHTFRAKLWVGLGAWLGFSLILLFRHEELISLFLHEGSEALDLELTLRSGKSYLYVMLLQMLPFALQQVYSSTLRETGETLLPMKAGITAVFVNLSFNYLLIFGKLGLPALGVTGAAVATLISRLTELGIILVFTRRQQARFPFLEGALRSLRVPRPLLRKIAVAGAPLLLNELLWSAGMTALNQSYSLRGLEVVSATNICTTASTLFFCAFFSMGATVSILVGQLLGAGELERAVDEDRRLIAFAVELCTAVGVLMFFVAPLIPELYNTTPAVKALAVRLLWVNAAMMPLNGFTNACYFTLRCGGKTLITFLFDSAFVWVFSLPTAFLLTRLTSLPILPIFIIVCALDLVKCGLGLYLVRSRKWVNNLVAS